MMRLSSEGLNAMICPRSRSWQVLLSRFKPRFISLQVLNLIHNLHRCDHEPCGRQQEWMISLAETSSFVGRAGMEWGELEPGLDLGVRIWWNCLTMRRRQWHPTPVLLPGKSHGRRSLVGYSPSGHEESDTTEWLHFHVSVSCIGEGNGNEQLNLSLPLGI